MAYDPLDLHRTTEGLPDYPYDPNTLLEVKQAAALLGVHPGTMMHWRARKIGPPMIVIKGPPNTRTHSLIRYRYGDLVSFIWHMRHLMQAPPGTKGRGRRQWTTHKTYDKTTPLTTRRNRRSMIRPGLRWRIATLILEQGGPLHVKEITRRLLDQGWTSRWSNGRHDFAVGHTLCAHPAWFTNPTDPAVWDITAEAVARVTAEPEIELPATLTERKTQILAAAARNAGGPPAKPGRKPWWDIGVRMAPSRANRLLGQLVARLISDDEPLSPDLAPPLKRKVLSAKRKAGLLSAKHS